MLRARFPSWVGCLLLAALLSSHAWSQDEAASAERAPSAAAVRTERQDVSNREVERDRSTASVVEQYHRMWVLSERGSVEASWWCLRHFDAARGVVDRDRALQPEERMAKLALYRQLATASGLEDRSVVSLISELAEEAARLGRRDVVRLLQTVARTSRSNQVKAAALYHEARLTADSTTSDVSLRARAISLYDQLLTHYPRDRHAGPAADARWRLEHLAIGVLAPDFVTYDVYGNEIRLSDFVGNVTVVRFWSAEDSGGERMRIDERTIVKHLWDERFVLIGINSDPVRADYMRVRDELQVTWTNAWEGGASRPAHEAWRSTGTPETFVLDAHGVIRYVGVEGPGLDAAVRQLLGEVRSRLYAPPKPSSDDEG
jgi:peroxiredoxin